MASLAFHERLRAIRSAHKLSQEAFAIKIGVPLRTYQTLEQGKTTRITAEALAALSEMGVDLVTRVGGKPADQKSVSEVCQYPLGQPSGENAGALVAQKVRDGRLLGAMEIAPRGEEADETELFAIPLYNDVPVAAGYGLVPGDESQRDILAIRGWWLRRELGASPKDVAALIVDGDSMTPSLWPGDLVLVNLAARQAPSDGIYVVRVEDSLLVKRLQRLPGGRIKLSSENQAYEPIELQLNKTAENGFRIIGRVMVVLKKM